MSRRDRTAGLILQTTARRVLTMHRGVRLANERLTEIIYKALLRELEYAEDFEIFTKQPLTKL